MRLRHHQYGPSQPAVAPRGERLIVTFRRKNGRRSPSWLWLSTGRRPPFVAYIEQRLSPTLKRSDIMVIDNLPGHKGPGEGGYRRRNLAVSPQSSPDLNPIEMPFRKFKAFLRRISEPTVRGLYRRIGSFVSTASRMECRGYFRHTATRPYDREPL